jgi:MSHA biogenesis protein MshI
VLNFLKSWKNAGGCGVVVTDDNAARFAVAQPATTGKPKVVSYGEEQIGGKAKSLAAALRGFRLGGIGSGATLLGAGEYQFLVVDAPDVPEAELKSAMKWRLKDIVGFPVEEATFDLLAIPGPDGAAFRTRSMFAVVSRSETLKRRVAKFDEARFPLSVIDVPETAQRNIAALYEEEGRGIVWLYFDESGCLMTISFNGELYHARRLRRSNENVLSRHAVPDRRGSGTKAGPIEIASANENGHGGYAAPDRRGGGSRAGTGETSSLGIADADEESPEEIFNRLLLELQRTLDNFERQFSFIPITKIMVGPEPEDTGLAAFLRQNLAVPVEEVALENVLDFPAGAVPGKRDQWRFFHLFGCALRNGAMAQ